MDDLAPIASFTGVEARTIGAMLARGVNAPTTTSAGRLFDGIAALAGLQQRAGYEGEAAMALEFAADPRVTEAYPFAIETGATLVIDWRPIVEAVVADVRRGRDAALIGARFHNSLARIILAVAEAVAQPRVALSGGCFQNKRLLETTVPLLEAAGFTVLLHRDVPPNDGGISLGQVAVAGSALA
jgi:hydrogenase maturation protein HypF